ncbi:8-oxo-dGTP diphosphatase MutT [Marinisporobacter balticus]|uniref:8-oxo-dGTP diphosphatase n=1 Tax=Marinisporobacter balticus TaxID=2018667 RepID=A0A4R2KST1_9FIRM|nr:8-oxo-dGTP diphosphatase MutT [Marinisporobacter balticus]TCO77431.1 8-oxo-dGTP diphosphatase [Marinisporobacter balticus]
MIDVVAAIIINEQQQILIAKRKEEKMLGGYWEFPGGKIESGETAEESLIRELMEEMHIDIKIYKYFGENIYTYERETIKLIGYIAEIVKGKIILTDHSDYKWVKKQELTKYNMAPADIYFIKKLEKEASI